MSDRPDDYWKQFADQPIPVGNVRVTIDRYELNQLDTEGYNAVIGYNDGKTKIKVGHPPTADSGMKIFVAKDHLTAAFSANQSSNTTRSTSKQFILMKLGTTASLDVVQYRRVPYSVLIPVYQRGRAIAISPYQVTGSSVQVTIGHVTEQGIEVELWPYFRSYRTGKLLRVNELRTQLIVPINRPVVIMADRSRSNSIASQWLSYQRSDQTTEVIVVITVTPGR